MPNICVPCTVNPALLLIEPDMLSSEQAAQLGKSRFRVTRANNARDVYLMRSVFHFSVAVLSDTLGCHTLRASAQIVRGQWPKARILVLGKAPIELDDHLYDETVAHASIGSILLKMIDKDLEDSCIKRTDAFSTGLGRISGAPRLQQGRTVWESDPTKVSRPVGNADSAKDLPASERLRRVTH